MIRLFDSFVELMTQLIHGLYGFTDMIGFPSYALAIVLLGIIVRILLLPLSIKQMKSTLAMSEVQPELKEIQLKYASNREKMNEEMQRLYKEYDVNPLAGCLPMFIQMPILCALFRALRTYDFSEHASLFWINSLNDVDQLHILPIILAVVMFLSQRLMMPKGSGMENNPSMKVMLYVMPLFMAFFSLKFPSGLCLYWITTSAVMIFQQMYMNHLRKKEMAIRAENRAKREAEREKERQAQEKKGHNPSKRKTKQQLKNEFKAKKKATYQPPSKEGSNASYKPPKADK